MRSSTDLAEELTNTDNEAQGPEAKKSRSDDKISNIATLDNGTMVETFKYLNYCQLAKNSLVSKRFWNMIHNHRHRLALLKVERISLSNYDSKPSTITIFNEKLSPEVYNDWAVRNQYSKQIPIVLEDLIAEKQNARCVNKVYELDAYGALKDSNDRLITVFCACAKLNHENWPFFQHFLRLLTDPFIYICSLKLSSQNSVMNLLDTVINPDRSRLSCNKLEVAFSIADNIPKFLNWIKGHVLCNKIEITDYDNMDYDKQFLDFFTTGARCTSEVHIERNKLSKCMLGLVEKFMDLKSSDECQMVKSMWSRVSEWGVEALKSNYAGFVVKEEKEKFCVYRFFEFVNNAAGKKMQLNLTDLTGIDTSHFTLKILNL
ncbi:hypothetical protein Ddc_23364 [Ditylenchus destructor]|nr:hypothetical protein Ddc_23364 [Ditylenchus destructor]